MAEETKKQETRKFISEITIPKGITAVIEKNELIIKKDKKESRRKLTLETGIKIENDKIIIKAKKTNKKEKRMFGTLKAHIKNMIAGLENEFSYKLQVSAVHFPMTASYDKNANEIVVKNFLGEKKDRRIKLPGNVDVKVDKDIVEIRSHNIEKAGQAAANIEKGTKVRNKDRRIYQDGIFIIEKPGRSFL